MKRTLARLLTSVVALCFCSLLPAQTIDSASLRQLLPTLKINPAEWISGEPTIIEVAPGGESLNEVIKRATPGTVIYVRAGDYPGPVDLSGLHGTPERPILLISADGPGMARLIGPPKEKHETVGAWGISNVGIYGFEITCDTGEGDYGGVKIGGPFAKPAENITLAGCLVTGAGQDGVKFLNGARHILVAGNIVHGKWRQECFDNVSIEKSVFAYNTTLPGCEARYTSLTIKVGSRDCEIVANDFKATTWAQVSVGGYGQPQGIVRPPYWTPGFQASNFLVHGNDLGGPKSVQFAGGRDSVLRGNMLRGTVGQGPGGMTPPRNEPSENNTIEDNERDVGPVGAAALSSQTINLRPGGHPRRPAPTSD